MIFKHIHIENFIPMLGCGTEAIDVDIVSNTLIVIGTNGCGKSSLFREITPFPANRSDYNKGGKRIVEIEHNGSHYILTSDFSKPVKPHSFIKDDEELNESGASVAQTDLCIEHFGITEIINSLINLEYHICDMGRADRKNLFMSTYPHSMDFILEYYKKVAYQIRDFRVNIKAYNERRLALEEKILNQQERERLLDLLSKYQNLNNDLDQQIYAAQQKIDLLKQAEEYQYYRDEDMPYNPWVDEFDYLRYFDAQITKELYGLSALRKDNPNLQYLFEGDLDKKRMNFYGFGKALEVLDNEITNEKSLAKELKEQLEEYEQVQSIDVEAEIKRLTERLAWLNSERQKALEIIKDKEFPRVSSADHLFRLNQNELSRIRYFLGEVLSANGVMAPEDVAKAKQEIWSLKLQIDQDEKQLEFYRNQLKELTERVNTVKNIDPNCRSSICHLKELVERKIHDNKVSIERVREAGRTTKTRLNENQQKRDNLIKETQNPFEANDCMIQLIETIQKAGIADFICDGKWDVRYFVKLINENGSRLWDKLSEFVTLNEAYLKIVSFDQEIKLNEESLNTMKKIHVPAKDLVIKTISEKQLQLKKNLERLERDQINYKRAEYDKEVAGNLIDYEIHFNQAVREMVKFRKWFENQMKINTMELEIDTWRAAKSQIQSSLMNLEATINEQNSLLTRLNEEVVPNLKRLESECSKWESVEAALNPTNGIPYRYMVKYLNSLIELVNKIIKCVWVYDMEILPLDENGSELDYNFQFTINGSDPIKDINLASKGQKEIMDLAWVLAIYHQMQLGKKYPLKLDEPDGGLINEHRVRLLNFLADMMKNGDLKQLFMVNHFPSVYDTFSDSQTLCICEEGIILPSEYNQHITVTSK